MKKCPFCAEEIQDAAVVCKHCGRDLVSTATAQKVEIVQTKKKTGCFTWVALIFVVTFFVVILTNYCSSVMNPTTPAKPAANAARKPAAAPSAQSAPAPAPAPAQNTAATESNRLAVAEMVKQGLIKRMDLTTGKIYISGELWEGFELDAKQQIVKVISRQREAEQRLPQVTLYESRSGKELASYGAFTGVTIR